MDPGVRSCRLPQAPWVLYFDGASRKPAGYGGWGVVLRNSKGQIVEEERKFLGAGVSSRLAKYKALLAGLKKAKSLQVKHLLAKGNSRILINQVVGRWTARDAHLRDHLKKVWVISKEFDSLFMEFIPKEHNLHADSIANAAIDKELQIQEVVSTYFDRTTAAWQASALQHKEPAPISPPARTQLPPGIFSNPKLSPRRETGSGIIKPLASALKHAATTRSCTKNVHVVSSSHEDVQTSDSDLTRTIKSLTSTGAKEDRFWADRLSISDEASTSSTTASEAEENDACSGPGSGAGYFIKSSIPKSSPTLEKVQAGARMVQAGARMRRGCCCEDIDSGEDAYPDACVEEVVQEFCNGPRSGGVVDLIASGSTSIMQLSEADYDRLVEAVIVRLKKTTRLGNNPDDHTSGNCLQHHL